MMLAKSTARRELSVPVYEVDACGHATRQAVYCAQAFCQVGG